MYDPQKSCRICKSAKNVEIDLKSNRFYEIFLSITKMKVRQFFSFVFKIEKNIYFVFNLDFHPFSPFLLKIIISGVLLNHHFNP